MTSNGPAPAPCDDRGEGRVADRLGGAISNLPSPSLHASQHIDLWRVFLAFDNASPLLALRAQLPDSCRHCGSKIATIVRGRGPHAAELKCQICDLRRGRLSKSTADALTKVVNLFGAPTTPIILRRGHGAALDLIVAERGTGSRP
jgi:hypothetical protein